MKKANLVFEAIPFSDNYFSSISAIDFLEHIPRQICLGSSNELVYPFINIMNEVWRVLTPGGKFLAVPKFDRSWARVAQEYEQIYRTSKKVKQND